MIRNGELFMPAILVIASWSLALAVNLAPLALGSNRALPWAYNAAICGAIALTVALYCLVRPSNDAPVRFTPIVLPKASGAMWLAAAKLRTLQDGFDATAETYLRRSYVLAPKEAGVAADRLAFTASIRLLVRENIDAEFQRDSDIVCHTKLSRYRVLARFFNLPDCDRV